jgi:hypothetical protein
VFPRNELNALLGRFFTPRPRFRPRKEHLCVIPGKSQAERT